MFREKAASKDFVRASLISRPSYREVARSIGIGSYRVLRKGRVIYEGEFENLVVNEGLDHKNGVVFLSGTQITSWFVIFLDGTPTIAAGDTYATHAGWSEVTNYDEATRSAWTGADVGTGTASNAASTADITISSGGATIGGVGLVGGGSAASTKGDTAGGGVLMSAAAFAAGDRVLLETDVLQITYQQQDSAT